MTGLVINQAEKVTITDDIVEKLISFIADNRIAPGDLLPSEKQLCEALGVSRLPLREALSRLKALGLVNSRQGKGAFVCKVDISNLFRQISPVMRSQGNLNMHHMVEVRQALEPAVAGLAAQRRDDESLAIMKACIDEMRRNIDDGREYIRADLEFHLALVRATGNPALETLVSTIQDIMAATQREVGRVRTIARTSLAYHTEIYDAIEAGNAAAAENAMLRHLGDVASKIEVLEDKE